MKPSISSLFAIALLFFFGPAADVSAQLFKKKSKAAQKAAKGKQTPPAASCIWRVQGDKCTVYLAGSVHLLRPQDLPLPPAYQAVYDDSLELVFEIDMNLMSDLEAVAKIRNKGMLQDGDSLENHIKGKTWRLLQKYAKERTKEIPGFAQFQIEKMKPGLAFITISSIESMRIGARPDLGLEQTFFTLAKRDAKPMSGLETMEFQMTLFDDMEAEQQDRLLRESLQSAEKMGETIDQMIQVWKTGDGVGLNDLLSQEMPEGDIIREILLKKRNENWIPHIEKAIAGDKNILFLVGAGHLVGGDSVVAMLREKGYIVEQISHGTKEVAAPEKAAAAPAE